MMGEEPRWFEATEVRHFQSWSSMIIKRSDQEYPGDIIQVGTKFILPWAFTMFISICF